MEADVPILLVGCKSDLRQQGQSLQQVTVPPLCEPHLSLGFRVLWPAVPVMLQHSRSRPL